VNERTPGICFYFFYLKSAENRRKNFFEVTVGWRKGRDLFGTGKASNKGKKKHSRTQPRHTSKDAEFNVQ
jgi:hypothetical protein